ncbi:MAG: methionine--tRNA ligase [bacterium]
MKKNNNFQRILVTSALPYANGPLHIGHLAGCYLPADIFVRYQRSLGKQVIHICGTDEHGVQMTLKADQEKITPQQLVDKYHALIKKALNDLGIYYENFSQTTREIHIRNSQKFFLVLLEKGYLESQEMEQLYCPNCKKFLPDRFVEGICPYCKKPEARGDQCESCGRWLEPSALIEPQCKICGTTPHMKTTRHWFFKLDKLENKLKQWQATKPDWKDNVLKFCENWFKDGLKPRAITRDIDWGVPVPVEGFEHKVLYVWFDAPIGYISATQEWGEKIMKDPQLWKKYWMDEDTQMIHFIGKDNIVFHAMVWPAMLIAHGDFILPDQIPANEFLNIESRKISTSRNWAVWVDEVLEVFPPDTLRYVISANAPENSDADFTWSEFQRRVNDELADILGNLVNRTLTFINKYYQGIIPVADNVDDEFIEVLTEAPREIGNYLSNFEVRKACAHIIKLAKMGNRIFQENEPWKTRKSDPVKCDQAIYQCSLLLDTLATVIEPIMPFTAEKIHKMMVLSPRSWDQAGSIRIDSGHCISKHIEILFEKIEDDQINQQVEKLGKPRKEVKLTDKPSAPENSTDYAEISDLQKLKLKIGTIQEVQKVPDSKNLYQLKVDLGEETRQLVAGMVPYYEESEMINKKVVVVSNLKPATIRGIKSDGMILAAENSGVVSLLTVDKDVPPGSKIR